VGREGVSGNRIADKELGDLRNYYKARLLIVELPNSLPDILCVHEARETLRYFVDLGLTG
jgi:hypothetical protein